MNINNEQLAKIWAAYWGCATTYRDDEGNACKVNAITMDFMIREDVKTGKLALTPLSKISDEDKLAIYAMGWTHCKGKNMQILHPKEWKSFTVEQLNYLRSKSYDMDNLIGSGIAKDIATA